jgi:hypothetical protein
MIPAAEMSLHIFAPRGSNQLAMVTQQSHQKRVAFDEYSCSLDLPKPAFSAMALYPSTLCLNLALPFRTGSLLEFNGSEVLTRMKTSTPPKEALL